MIDLNSLYDEVLASKNTCLVETRIAEPLSKICRCNSCKAPIRFLMAGLVAKIDDTRKDLHRPASFLGQGCYDGRSIDETIIEPFIHNKSLPCNPTTAFLTPAFRTIDTPITKDTFAKCRPSWVYKDMMDVIEYIQLFPDSCTDILKEIIRNLLVIKEENESRIAQQLNSIRSSHGQLSLSSEDITKLLIQHLSCKNSSRLPVLAVAAAYDSVKDLIKEEHKPLLSHNAADKQTGAVGDVEIVLSSENATITCYEMKKKAVTRIDIQNCVDKIAKSSNHIDNYIVITTDTIDPEVNEYASSLYKEMGTEIVILDCIGFIRHFLHFFHRRRLQFLDNYQQLVLSEPASSVPQPLKEAFLTLRIAAEYDSSDE